MPGIVKPRITFVIGHLGIGGAEKVCATLASGFSRRGWTVTLLTLHHSKTGNARELHPGVCLQSLECSKVRFVLWRLARYLCSHPEDTLVLFNFELSFLAVLLCRMLRLPNKIVSRSINTLSAQATEFSAPRRLWLRMVIGFAFNGSWRVIAQSKGMHDDLIDCYQVSRGKLRVISNPLSPRFERADSLLAEKHKQNYLLIVARLEPQKDIPLALRAFALATAKRPELRLVIAGEGSQADELRALAHELGIARRVDFVGCNPNPVAAFWCARLTLLTSHYEGFPNVLIESMSQGTPVISVNCPSGPDEIVREGVNGLVVQSRDPAVFAQAIEQGLATDWDPVAIVDSVRPFFTEAILDRYERTLLDLE